MDARKILKDLQYRIDTAPDDDPEKENAIRLRDAMAAAEALSDTLFPQMQVEQETLRLAKGA